MTGLASRIDFPIAWGGPTLEIAAVAIGWSLGGTIGLSVRLRYWSGCLFGTLRRGFKLVMDAD